MAMLKTITKYVSGALLLLLLVLLVNTLRLPSLPAPAGEKAPALVDIDAAAQRLSAAIKIPTISYGFANPPGGNRFPELHALLVTSFPLVHATLKREWINGSSLLYTWSGSDPSLAPILLTAHQDVVPVEPGTEAGWTHPPFSGAIVDGYVWGRGSMDNKQMMMATFEGVERLLAIGFKPKRTVILAFGHDEEMRGVLGAKFIADELERRKVRAQFSIDEGSAILQGVVSGIDRPIAQIGVADKGGLSIQLKAEAPAGHSSMPPASTAVGKLGRAIARLEENQMPGSLSGPGGESLRALAPALPFMQRVTIANSWLFGPLLIRQLSKVPNTNALIRTTTAPTVIKGGIKDNVLPSEATAIVNFRLAPGDRVEAVKAHVTAVIDDPSITMSDYHPQGGVEATAVADSHNPGYKLISEALQTIEPSAIITPSLVIAGTDSKHYQRVAEASFRFTPMRINAGDLKRIHATDERIGVANYGEIISFYVSLIKAGAQ